MLPKLHKNKLPPPGRPIISGNNSPTERISQLVDHFLKPASPLGPSYIKDTTHFLQIMSEVGPLPPGCLLVTLDVSSLYTNIPNAEGIQAALEALETIRPGAQHPTNPSLIKLLELVLKSNNFTFCGRHFLQIGGAAMGTRAAPNYAITHMHRFEKLHVYTYHLLALLWKRFIDDIFLIWQHGLMALLAFIHHLNSCHPTIKFTFEISTSHLPFLDTMVHLESDGTLWIDLYTKPTDAHNYLRFESSHPFHTRKSLPYSQFLRIRRICSNTSDFLRHSILLKSYFLDRGYPYDLLEDAFIRTLTQNRHTLLFPPPTSPTPTPNPTPSDNKDPLFAITTYHPSCTIFQDTLQENWHLLGAPSTQQLYATKVTFGKRRAKNLRDHLVRAQLKSDPDDPYSLPTSTPRSHCQASNCPYCPILDTSGTIKGFSDKKKHRTRTNVSCLSDNLIYAIECTRCHQHYVGQTMLSLCARMYNHFRDIRMSNRTRACGAHFSTPPHLGLKDVKLFVLEFCSTPKDLLHRTDREACERRWQFRLRSNFPLGINRDDALVRWQ